MGTSRKCCTCYKSVLRKSHNKIPLLKHKIFRLPVAEKIDLFVLNCENLKGNLNFKDKRIIFDVGSFSKKCEPLNDLHE